MPRTHEQTLALVLDAARRQLGEVGPAQLSLRAVAREVGLVPSALYRYVDGRDAILSALIRTGYERLADAADGAAQAVAVDDVLGRWCALWHGARGWAIAHPHEYALLYGTPVIGYAAPPETVVPATRVVVAMARLVDEASRAGRRAGSADSLSAGLTEDAAAVASALPTLGLELAEDVEPAAILDVIDAWTALFGAISFEVFGHYTNSVGHHEEHLERLARLHAQRVGLLP